MNRTKTKRTVTSSLLVVLFLAMGSVTPVRAEEGGDKQYLEGKCWLTGAKTCRKRKKGDPCDPEKIKITGCSVKDYLGAAGQLLTMYVVLDSLDDDNN